MPLKSLAKAAAKSTAKGVSEAGKRSQRASGEVQGAKEFFQEVFSYVNKNINDVLGIDNTTGKKMTEARKKAIEQTRKGTKGMANTRDSVRKAVLGTTAVAGPVGFSIGSATKDAKEALPENPTQAQVKSAARSALKKQKVPTSVIKEALAEAAPAKKQSEKRASNLDELMSKSDYYKGGYKKAKRKMAGGGMMNGKKSRTGSMDYRKGGLFK